MEKLLGITPEPRPAPPVSIHNGKWSYYGTPVGQLDKMEQDLVFDTIQNAINIEQDRTNAMDVVEHSFLIGLVGLFTSVSRFLNLN